MNKIDSFYVKPVVIIGLLFYAFLAQSQSKIFISQDKNFGNNQKIAYCYAYNASEEELTSIIEDRLFEKGITKPQTFTCISTSKKGYGMVVKSGYISEAGKVLVAYGTAIGCKSFEEAKRKAIDDLQKNNPEWKSIAKFEVVAQFEDK